MGDIFLWLGIGLLAGAVASIVLPGRTPGGALEAIIIGILGGVFGGWVLDALDVGQNLTLLGALGVAVLAAGVLLQLMRSVNRTSRI